MDQRPPRRRVDRLTVLNWLAFLAVLGVALAEGVAMWDAKRRRARDAAAASASPVAAPDPRRPR